MKKNFIFAVAFFVFLSGSSVVLATENGTEECDASFYEKIANDVEYIKASLPSTILGVKRTVEELIKEQKLDSLIPDEADYEASKKEYEEAIRRYWAKSGHPMPK